VVDGPVYENVPVVDPRLAKPDAASSVEKRRGEGPPAEASEQVTSAAPVARARTVRDGVWMGNFLPLLKFAGTSRGRDRRSRERVNRCGILYLIPADGIKGEHPDAAETSQVVSADGPIAERDFPLNRFGRASLREKRHRPRRGAGGGG
jgi:hypothetical protein